VKKVLQIFILVSGAIFILASISGCTNTTDHTRSELNVGLMASIDAFPIVIAYRQGYFEDEGLNVNLIPFSSAGTRDASILAGELDATTADLVAVGLFIEAGLPIRATGLTGGRFTLVANEGFYSINDLKGEAIVISENTAIDFVLDHMVTSAGFELDHIKRSIVPSIPDRMELLRAGQATAAVLPEPWASIAINDGLYGITNTIDLDFIPFIIAFTDSVLENQPEDVRAFYRAYNRAIDFLNNNPLEAYFYMMVEEINFSEAVADFLILPDFTHNTLPEMYVLEAAIDWLITRKLVSPNMNPTDLINRVAFE